MSSPFFLERINDYAGDQGAVKCILREELVITVTLERDRMKDEKKRKLDNKGNLEYQKQRKRKQENTWPLSPPPTEYNQLVDVPLTSQISPPFLLIPSSLLAHGQPTRGSLILGG